MNNCIWIIIPVYNRKKMTRTCLESLTKQEFRNFQIIVIDDGSSDGTQEMIEGQFPRVHLIKGDGNLFWAKATNLGVNEALKKANQDDYILTLNNDLTVKPDYLNQLMNLASKSPKSLIGSISLDSDDNERILDGGVRIHWLTAKFEHLKADKKYKELMGEDEMTQTVDALPGRGTLIPVNVFKEIGLYNAEQLPQYAADYEFSIRSKRRGYQLLINYQAIVVSHIKETGLNNAACFLRWRDYLKSFVSIRSANNLHYRWNFSRLCFPGIKGYSFFIMDTARVILGTLRNQILQKLKGEVRINRLSR